MQIKSFGLLQGFDRLQRRVFVRQGLLRFSHAQTALRFPHGRQRTTQNGLGGLVIQRGVFTFVVRVTKLRHGRHHRFTGIAGGGCRRVSVAGFVAMFVPVAFGVRFSRRFRIPCSRFRVRRCRVSGTLQPAGFFTEKFAVTQTQDGLIFGYGLCALPEGFRIQRRALTDQLFGIENDLALTAELCRQSARRQGRAFNTGLLRCRPAQDHGARTALLRQRCTVVARRDVEIQFITRFHGKLLRSPLRFQQALFGIFRCRQGLFTITETDVFTTAARQSQMQRGSADAVVIINRNINAD